MFIEESIIIINKEMIKLTDSFQLLLLLSIIPLCDFGIKNC